MKLTAILLLLAMLFAAIVLAGCSNTADDVKQTDTTAGDDVENRAETVAAVKRPNVPEENFNGAEFVILTRGFGVEDPWGVMEVSPESDGGEILNDSVYERNRMVEERCNVTIKQLMNDTPLTLAQRTIQSQDPDVFDAAWPDLFSATTLAQANMLINLNSVKYFDFTREWWDQSSIRDLSIGDKQYIVTGDFSYRTFNASWIYAFNKNLVEKMALDSPYDLVNGGKWTIDKFVEMVKSVSDDVDGNGIMDENDRFGLITEDSGIFGMYIGAENFVVSKDKDNYPMITINTERGITTLEKLFAVMNDRNFVTHTAEAYFRKYPEIWGALVNIFTDDRALLYSIVMYTVKKLRDMESDFGLIPMPKYDERQDKYYTWTSPWISSALILPVTNLEPERAAILMEEMSYQSMITVRPAYYDVSLEGKYTRDTESVEMLNIILGNRVYDLGMIYDWGGVGMLINSMSNAKADNFSSRYESIAERAQTALEKTIDEYKSLN
ncbi:MAG: hypothetical protein FWF15_00755 [Oscillospiraceae bacterium]|nr:hypothetical protein [Oscillospiraceae bacterium]